MAVPFITVNQGRKPLACKPGSTLLDALVENGVVVDNPCNGKGTCGKCRVRVRSETLTPATETEKRLVPRKELDSGVRLACQLVPTEDMSVELMQGERGHTVLTEGILPDFTHKVDIEKKMVTIEKPTLENQEPLADQIARQLGLDALSVVAVAHVLLQPGRYTAVMHEGQLIAVEPGDTTEALYGVAIDIGTTTVVCELVDMRSGDILADASQINAQKIYGLDVLTRITYELEHPENGRENLQKAIVDSLNEMIGSACAEAGVARSSVYEVTVGANCTMMHMLLGVDATPIGKAPFAPVFARAQDIPADAIGLDVAAGARLYCLPHVSAYIGADIVAGAYVCQLQHETGNVLFIDIGTNGEIVLANDGRLICCSCAAGPALEGMNISAGMRASEGAIEEIRVSEDGISCTVIGDGEPAGLCGSGILAVMRELLSTGIVRKNGAFAKIGAFPEDDYRTQLITVDEAGKRAFMLDGSPDRLLVTQGDVRQVQLAKGAILSGFMALLEKAGIAMKDLDKATVAGQFGAHLSADSITGTGILPAELESRIEYAGNTSKTGAYMALMSSDAKRGMERLADEMDYVELNTTENYERLFSDCLIFPSHVDAEKRSGK